LLALLSQPLLLLFENDTMLPTVQ
ncbi:hypothetical protein A2U01_0077260, partial [Trifolium medium]|nr:hypothetical protein [Trifolium medium]